MIRATVQTLLIGAAILAGMALLILGMAWLGVLPGN